MASEQPERVWIERAKGEGYPPSTGFYTQPFNDGIEYITITRYNEVVNALDSCRMGGGGKALGCFCVSSPTQTSQSDWKHNANCKRLMKVLKAALGKE
jgi:hypothetical protein